MKSKLLIGLLSLNLLFTTDSVANFVIHAHANAEDNICEHHPEHTDECGYVEGVSPCNYDCEICNAEEVEATQPTEEATTEPTVEPTEQTAPQTIEEPTPTATKEPTIDYVFEGDVFYKNNNGTWEVNPTATKEQPLTKDELLQQLPQNIILTIDDQQQTIPVTWNLDNYGESQYEGEFYLIANIAEDVELPEGFTREIRVLVAFDSPNVVADAVRFEFVEYGSDGQELAQDSTDRYILHGTNKNGEEYFYVNPEKLKNYTKEQPMNCDNFLKTLPRTVRAYDANGNIIPNLSYNVWKWNKHDNIKTAYKGKHVLLYYFKTTTKSTGTTVEIAESNQIQVVLEFPYEFEDKSKYQVDTLSPSNVKVNLYDYWIRDSYSSDSNHDNVGGTNVQTNKNPYYFLRGINESSNGTYHPFIFAGIAYSNKPKYFGDGYNTYTRYTVGEGLNDPHKGEYAYQGIVKNTLDADGYPVLNLSQNQVDETFAYSISNSYMTDKQKGNGQESLSYLFNEDTQNQSGKAVYSDVSGLFQLDKDGYYYFDSTQNFAEYDETYNRFNLYNTTFPSSGGQFFPLNSVEDLFDETDKGLQVYKNNGNGTSDTLEPVHHYFGLTMSVEFQQPIGGTLTTTETSKPMQFNFSGDDDIWIYIDGVLVSDLGGIHDKLSTTIDFSTGEVTNSANNKNKVTKTLKQLFEEAGKYNESEFDGNRFKDYSKHELKVFYLERGNTSSNLKLQFNLMEPQSGSIVKVDQDGQPLNDVEFDLYEANEQYEITNDNPIGHYKTGDDGIDGNAYFYDSEGKPLAFDEKKYYVLKEVKTLEGYVTTGDIHLKYDKSTGILNAVNKWETGAVSSFTAQVYQAGDLLYYDGSEVGNEGRTGLIVAVPQFFTGNNVSGDRTDTSLWKPMYGSVTDGFNLVKETKTATSDNNQRSRTLALQAATNQILNHTTEYWHLDYNENSGQYYANLVDLPGSLDRYYNSNNPNGVFEVAYYLLDPSSNSVLTNIFSKATTAQDKYKAIENLVSNSYKNVVSAFAEDYQSCFKLLDISKFNRLYYTRLYIPNQVRELGILKQDENGNPLGGAQFTLYEDKACTKAIATGTTSEGREGTEKSDKGRLYFSTQYTEDSGSYVHAALTQKDNKDTTYYLKEVKAPDGYEINNTVIEVKVTKDSIYVNAGNKDDGVSVRKGIKGLLQTVTRYAASEDIDVTLRDLTLKFYKYKNVSSEQLPQFNQGWDEIKDYSSNLHYGLPGRDAGFEFGVHEDSNLPYYTLDEGWLAFGVTQNYNAHTDNTKDNPYYVDNTKVKQDLTEYSDLSQLTPDATTVVVTDKKTDGNIFLIKKSAEKDSSGHQQLLADAKFKLEKLKLKDDTTDEWIVDDSYKFDNKENYIEATTNKDGIITFTKLSYGRYRITETKAPSGYILLKNPIDVTIDEDEFKKTGNPTLKTITVTVENEKGLTMPLTGGNGRNILMYAIVGFALLGIATLMYRRREEKKI